MSRHGHGEGAYFQGPETLLVRGCSPCPWGCILLAPSAQDSPALGSTPIRQLWCEKSRDPEVWKSRIGIFFCFFFFNLIFIPGNVHDLEYCVWFPYLTAKSIQSINSSSDSFPIHVISECYFQFSVIYSGCLVALGKESIWKAGDSGSLPGVKDLLREAASHSGILAWDVLWSVEPGGP